MFTERLRVTSGVSQLDRLLGGLFIGDNVVWYDDAGSLASVFCMNFIRISKTQNKPMIYVTFDRSPKNLLEKLGPLAENRLLTILDCFTYGKGTGSDVFLQFYEKKKAKLPCKIVRVDEPHDPEQVMDALYDVHTTLKKDDVRFVFESLTGMQELWDKEEDILRFYSRACPRLYELNTIAYWIIEKHAHSNRLRAHINKIAQVAIDLSLKRGKTYLSVLKAEKRDTETISRTYNYWHSSLNDQSYEIMFDANSRAAARFDLGMRLKELRTKRGLSQKELARLVGVTPSTISQVESNLIYPSLPALLKMTEILSIDMGAFFRESADVPVRVVFPASEAADIKITDMPRGSIRAKRLTPAESDFQAQAYLIEIPAKKNLPSHFFIHKGEEIGYVISGKLQLKIGKAAYMVHTGDVVYLTSEMPSQWRNPGPEPVKLLWIKIR